MLGDSFSKLVHGSLCKKFISALMGWTHISELLQGYNNLEERVGNNVKKVQNDKKHIDMSNTSQAVRIAAKKSSTYAEAVKKHNVNFLKSINEHIS